MLNAVSNVHFTGNDVPQVSQPNDNPFARPGAFSVSEDTFTPSTETEPKKKSSLGKKLLIGAGVVAAVAAGLIALKHFNIVDLSKDLEKAGIMEKASHYLAQAGEWLEKNTIGRATELWNKFRKPAEELTEDLTPEV